MQLSELPALVATVLWATFGLALAFGALSQRTHFCTMGAVADLVTMGDWSRMRMWVLAMGVAVLGFNGMAAAGWIDAADSVYARPQLIWLSNAAGGALFGFGMVLASGCSSKMLVRIGGGSLKAMVVFCVLGLASYATLRGLPAVWRVATVDQVALTLPVTQDLPSLLAHWTGLPRGTAIAAIGGAVGLGLVGWALARPEGRRVDTLLGGAGIGALVVAGWWVSGRLGHVSEHPGTLERAFLATDTRAMESFTFVAPIAYTLDWLILYSDASRHLSIGIVAVVGVVAGSALASLAGGRFRWEGFAGTEDTANHLVGAVLMGVGGVTAFGCTVGQGLTGVSTLSVGSFIALAGILAGAVGGLRYQGWRMERLA
ncbi:MAG: YeeE/YedE family protein [Rubrivivax sp.]|nr:YeeE/YedE family protein [Rubrivivax sp.]